MNRPRNTPLPFLLLCAWPFIAHAGDRRADVLLVNMTPDSASNAASRKCFAAVEARIRADYTEVKRLGETPLRGRVGKTAGEPMLAFTAEELARAQVDGDRRHDAVILVDCRPEQKALDVVVTPSVPGVTRIQVRRVELGPKRLELVMDAVLRRAWVGFSP